MKKILFLLLMFISLVYVNRLDALTLDSEKDEVYLGGETIGLKLDTGVIVAKVFGINDGLKLVKPWKDAGIKENDIILSYNNCQITSNNDLLKAIEISNGNEVDLIYNRNGLNVTTTIKPYLKDKTYSLGIYVKDNISGVGTLTYIVPANRVFGALGHQIEGVNDTKGLLLEAKVTGINKGVVGEAGSKKAKITTKTLGSIEKNTVTGIHGIYTAKPAHTLVKIGKRDMVVKGEAYIVTAINDHTEKYCIDIIEVNKQDAKAIKGIKFRVVDEKLLNETGGIIQGMSGSPIIQNDRLVGAVTHVLVNNPEEGYGIFIEFMFEEMGITIN